MRKKRTFRDFFDQKSELLKLLFSHNCAFPDDELRVVHPIIGGYLCLFSFTSNYLVTQPVTIGSGKSKIEETFYNRYSVVKHNF